MDFLSELDADDIAQLSNEDFRDEVQREARSLAGDALDTYREVMNGSDDDRARIAAADKVLALAGIEEKQAALPDGISADVFKLALAGLGQLAGIAKTSPAATAILRNVTPAHNDPRPQIEISAPIDDSPMNRRVAAPHDDNESIVNFIAGERYEIVERS
jgi:hypothetical protein